MTSHQFACARDWVAVTAGSLGLLIAFLSGRLLSWVVLAGVVVLTICLIRVTFAGEPPDAAEVHLRIWRRLYGVTPLQGTAMVLMVFVNELATWSPRLYLAVLASILLLTVAVRASRPGTEIPGWVRRPAQ